MVEPLSQLLSNSGFHWTPKSKKAFQDFKDAISQAPILGLPDFTSPFVVESDARRIRIGVVLMQNCRPIAYYSEALKGSELNLSTYKKEMLAVVQSILKWHPYLLSKTFTVRTDQKSLIYILEQHITTPAQACWLPKLMGFDYHVEYKKGSENTAADSLSCITISFISVSKLEATWWQQLQLECQTDPYYASLASFPRALQRDGIWFQNGKVLLNLTKRPIPILMAECHSTPVRDHFGFHKTLSHLRRDFRCPGMRNIVKTFIQKCTICQQNKYDSMSPAGLLQPLPVPE